MHKVKENPKLLNLPSARDGCEYHLFCSEHNPGGATHALELGLKPALDLGFAPATQTFVLLGEQLARLPTSWGLTCRL